MLAFVVVLVQAAAAWATAGAVWTMQVLNYPLLARIGPESFAGYETAHNRRFATVIGPGVAVAAATTGLLFFSRPATLPLAAPVVGALLLAAILIVTARYAAPAHTRLAGGFDPAVLATLVRSNLVRALAWTALGVLDLWMLGRLASAGPRA